MEQDRFLNVEELAEYLNESVGTIYHWVSQRRIPFYKRGRRIQFKKSENIEWDRDTNRPPPGDDLAETL